jgi:acyl-CoA thioesterase-2
MVAVAAILEALRLEEVGPDRYRGANVADVGHGVVFGGQLLGQSIVAAQLTEEAKLVKTVHTVFARGAAPDDGLDIGIDRMSSGRSIASVAVTISQQGRLCTRSIVMLSADEPDLISHAAPPPPLSPPPPAEGPEAAAGAAGEWEVQVVGGADINDPDAVGRPELDVWTRFSGAPEDPAMSQALLGFATDGFLIGTAMRPHRGVGQAQAHRTLSTGVLSHTLTFHEPFTAAEWMLMAHHSPYAGRGRSYGRADVFRADGRLVASFVQDNMIRPKSGGPGSL